MGSGKGGPLDAASLLAAAAALAVSLYALYRLRSLERLVEEVRGGLAGLGQRLEGLEEDVRSAVYTSSLVYRALGRALESVEAEDALERLRRRRRRRYIVFRLVTEDGSSPPPDEVERALLRSLERLGGQLAVALGRVQLVYYNPDLMAGIVRASHDTKYLVLAAMGMVRRVAGKRALMVPVRTTGTIKRAKQALGLPQREAKT